MRNKEQDAILKKMCIASHNGDLHKVQKYLSKHPELAQKQTRISQKIKFKGSVLHYAVGPNSENDLAVVSYLLAQGCNPNYTNNQKNSPLHCALNNLKDVKTIKTLVDAGTYLDHQNKLGETPLHRAIYSGETENVELLLINGAPLDIPTKKGCTLTMQPFNPLLLQRNAAACNYIAKLVYYAKLFQDTNDQIAFIAKPISDDITPRAQQLAFKTLVETCELEKLTTLHDTLIATNPDLLGTLLKKVPIKIRAKNLKDRHKYHTALCYYWLTMPNKIIRHVCTGKLDNVLTQLKMLTPASEEHAYLWKALSVYHTKTRFFDTLTGKATSDLSFHFT